MFKKAGAALLLSAALLIGGCAPGASKTVTLTCTAPLDEILEGMEMTVTITAPARDQPIDSLRMEEIMYYDQLEELISSSMPNGTELPENMDMKLLMNLAEDVMISTITQNTGIPEEQIKLKTEDDRLIVTIEGDDPRELLETIGGSDVTDDDMIFENAAKNLEKSMTCE